MAMFFLVHGGQHGAWCFERLIPELERRGHSAAAVDLPIGDPDAGSTEYAGIVAAALRDVRDDVILVGHSMGGLVIPLVSQLRPVKQLVFLCGAIPEPGRSHLQVKAEEAGEAAGAGPSAVWQVPGDRHLAPREMAREMFYNDCSRDLQDWALDRLRPQCRRPLTEITPLLDWPVVPVVLINTTDDRCIPPPAAELNAMRLFHRRPAFLPGGHVSFLAHPEPVAEALAAIERQEAVPASKESRR